MRRRFVVVAVGIAAALLAPILLWGVIVWSTVVDDIGRRESEQRVLTARLAGASIERTLEEAERRLDLLATRERLRAALSAGDDAALERHLADLTRGTIYATALALDPAGRLLARQPAAPETYGQSFADRDYYRGAVAGNGVYISEAVVSRITGQTVVVLALAVREREQPVGLLLLTLTPAHLLELLQPLRSTSGRDIHVVDQQARVIASTDPLRAPLSELRLPGVELLDGQTRSIAARVDGTEKVVTFAPVPMARWALVVTDDTSVIHPPPRTFEKQHAAGGAATLALSLAAAGGIAWLFTTTLRQRTLIAEREQALARTNADLQDASRHKSDFLSSMSHELRTPLNAILGFSDLLQEQLASSLTDRQKRYVKNIRDAGEHLLALINDVLDLAKVEAGKVELRPEMIAVAALVDPVVASSRSAAGSRGLDLAVRLPPTDPAVMVDAGRLRQILYNLLSNALKFTPPGGSVRLDVALDGPDLVIEVADTGIGIPADKRDRVFGTFERLHEGRSNAPGTGLGLALTKELVELQGGSIGFESEEGRGSTFRVRVPSVLAAVVAEDRVLVVEDEQRDAELIVALTAKAGLQSEIVRTVAGAYAAIRRARPIAVVLDLRLPDGRGEEVIEHLKGDPVTRDVPVVVVTVEDDDPRSRTLGADDHLIKPIDHARLDGWLRQIAARTDRKEGLLAAAAGR